MTREELKEIANELPLKQTFTVAMIFNIAIMILTIITL